MTAFDAHNYDEIRRTRADIRVIRESGDTITATRLAECLNVARRGRDDRGLHGVSLLAADVRRRITRTPVRRAVEALLSAVGMTDDQRVSDAYGDLVELLPRVLDGDTLDVILAALAAEQDAAPAPVPA